jgi:hypothetical protein
MLICLWLMVAQMFVHQYMFYEAAYNAASFDETLGSEC